MLTIFAKSMNVAARQDNWNPPPHWREDDRQWRDEQREPEAAAVRRRALLVAGLW